ncbi:hypothetical protein KIW84_060054 [Lathyrus oleraceus]|uniref:Uncharacterized protein n=1 Tax=Pisum sativum TaxID=3888 RepID=A0A9D5A4M7_PEA|nr:hypothetical protein KIW84_060054 [Pisum sativum]
MPMIRGGHKSSTRPNPVKRVTKLGYRGFKRVDRVPKMDPRVIKGFGPVLSLYGLGERGMHVEELARELKLLLDRIKLSVKTLEDEGGSGLGGSGSTCNSRTKT